MVRPEFFRRLLALITTCRARYVANFMMIGRGRIVWARFDEAFDAHDDDVDFGVADADDELS